jgi:hypothetical protein
MASIPIHGLLARVMSKQGNSLGSTQVGIGVKISSRCGWGAWLPRSRYELCYLAIPLLYFPAFYLLRVSSRAHDLDYGAYYAWAYGIRQGINPYIAEHIGPLADCLNFPRMTANYPPIFILAFTPLTRLSIEHAFVLWSAINAALLIAAISLLLTIVKPLSHPMLWS